MKKIIIAQTILKQVGSHGTIFERSNITTYPARTSEEILTLHGVHNADIIITEADLPRMGGGHLCAAIREDQRLRDVAIIVLGEIEASRGIQANAILSKPLDPGQLFWKVSELLLAPQRQDMRTLLHATVNGREKNKAFLGHSKNVSISGMLLETTHVVNVGDRLTCTFHIGGREIVADAEVMRVMGVESGKRQYGVRFVNLYMKYIVLIEQFIKGRVKH